MSTTTTPPSHDLPGEQQPAGTARLHWTDVDGATWRVELGPQDIRLQPATGDGPALTLPRNTWTRDIYVAEDAGRVLVRFDTFQCAVRFLLSTDDATPLLAHLGAVREPPEAEPDSADEPSPPTAPLLWPKVSPLAVWAVILSALSFVPLIGLVPAGAAVVLLVAHRRKVRAAPAWAHSRSLCTVASVLVVFGLVVAVLAIRCGQLPRSAASAAAIVAPATPGGHNWGLIVGALFIVIVSLSVHEAAHAITAWWLGDAFARSQGRVTLNPLAHIDPFGTILLPILLAWAHAPVFGYARPVQVRVESLPRFRRAHILIALAGPGSNLLLGAVSLSALLAIGCVVRLSAPDAVLANVGASVDQLLAPVTATGFALASIVAPLCTLLKLSFLINTALAIFNLVPIPPLDGSWVLEHLFPITLGRLFAAIRPYGFLIFVGAIYFGLFQYLFLPIAFVVFPGMGLVSATTGY